PTGYAVMKGALRGCRCEETRWWLRSQEFRCDVARFLGRAVSREELSEKLLRGGPSETRDAFLRANGEILEEFAAAMRRSLNLVSPSTRLGFCSCITSWDLDGTTPDRISRILAGNTRPFYRLIGAPYWAALRAWGNRLGDVLELERSEASRREDGDIEIYSEGDTYPRPRFKTPASYLEIFDTVLRAAGCTDGILKYALDYVSSAEYETGYVSAARRHAAAYAAIDRFFTGKTPVGVRVYDKPDKYKTFRIPEHIAGTPEAQNLAFSATSRFLAAGSIPTVYEGRGLAGAAFGDDALCVPEEALSGGMILDVSAAKRLWEKGVDVGVLSFGEQFLAKQEFFADGVVVSIPNAARAEALVLKPGAKVLSRSDGAGPDALPLSYMYRNERGGRFLVFAMEGYFGEQDWFRQYARQKQIASFLKACGRSLPAFCPGHPELYVLAEEGDGELAVGLWNIFQDRMLSPEVILDRVYDRAEAFGCEATLDGNVVRLSDIAPYDFAFLRLS
ncbi:MAG: hypothetical protein IKX85_03245, partial [Clostridia bacterium]|nr:hypothetical protein [Clostridia bacterium]